VHPGFIRTLVGETLAALDMTESIRSCAGSRLCPTGASGCPHADVARKAGQAVKAAAD
jgi:ferrochelatase